MGLFGKGGGAKLEEKVKKTLYMRLGDSRGASTRTTGPSSGGGKNTREAHSGEAKRVNA